MSTLLLLVFVSVIYQRSALKNLSYTRYFSASTVYQGEQIEMVEEIANRKLLPLPGCVWNPVLPGGLNSAARRTWGSAAVRSTRIISACSI